MAAVLKAGKIGLKALYPAVKLWKLCELEKYVVPTLFLFSSFYHYNMSFILYTIVHFYSSHLYYFVRL
jgi:hypothetical protein